MAEGVSPETEALPGHCLTWTWLHVSLWPMTHRLRAVTSGASQVSGLGYSGHGEASARCSLAMLCSHVGRLHRPGYSSEPKGAHILTPDQEPPTRGGKGRWARRPRPLGLCRREGLPSLGVSCVLSQSAQEWEAPGSVRPRSAAAGGCPDFSLLSPGQPGAAQDGAVGVLRPSCPLGPRVPGPAPLALGAVLCLPQVRPSLSESHVGPSSGVGLQASPLDWRLVPLPPASLA